jgi:cell division transport system permease protein
VQAPKQKKTLGSYPYFTVVFSITMALFVIGLFGLVLLHASRLSEIIKGNIAMQVYLQRTLTETERDSLYQVLIKKPYVATATEGRPEITFISKDEAADKFIAETGENFVKFLGQNPLRDAYEIRIKPEYAEAEKMSVIKKDLLRMPGIFEVEYVESMVNAINNNLSRIGIVLISFALFLIITVAVLINNTIKLALFSQRFLIRSMQLVGAKGSFIKRPFVTRAAMQGLMSGILAILLLGTLLQYAYSSLPELELLYQTDKTLILFAILIVAGGLMGFVSSLRSVNKYLRMSLDELY